MRAQSECQSYAQCGCDNIKKVLLDFFQKIAGSSGQSPWSLHRNGAKSLIPKTSSARGSKMPAGILRRGRIARASPMDEVGSMPTSSIKIERAYHYRLRSHWNYVGRHGANKFLTAAPRRLSGGQSCDGTVPVLPVCRHLLSQIVLSS